jgi:hypothetical protein
MHLLCWFILLTAAYPLWRAWQANRRTSLVQAVHWAIIAWAGWGVAFAMANRASFSAAVAGSYLALGLTGCAAIAVLGARRPGVGAWNFVVVALLAVDVLPLARAMFAGNAVELDTVHLICVAATVVVGVLNYLPTRLAPAALLLLAGGGLVLYALLDGSRSERRRERVLEIGWLAVACVPWVAYGSIRSREPPAAEFDRLWLDYRDRFGLVWSQRLREQFNRSAVHAGWPAVLRWPGLRLLPGASLPDAETQQEIVNTLRALMKRFKREEDNTSPTQTAQEAEPHSSRRH